jgi:glycosyltransferase involved in cell wall biosynthesis
MTQITVGIPVFNAMPYLPEALESILRQSYTDFTILAINDGSTDGSLEYLQSIRDPRLRIQSQQNQGLTSTLNRMLFEVKTPWLLRFDSDDVAYPHRLALTIEYIARYPRSGMLYSMAEYYPKKSVGQFRATKGSPADIRALVQSGYLPSICHPTVTLNVDKTLAVGAYRFDLHVEDIDLWWRMALNHDIQMIPEVTLGFRQHLKSVSATNLERQALSILYVQYLLLSHLWNLTPLPYPEAQQPLSLLFNRRQMKFKTHLRSFNIELGRGQLVRAACEAGHALFTSPKDLSRRVLDEIVSNRRISVGQPTALFERYKSTLWPEEASSNAHSKVPSPLPYPCALELDHMRAAAASMSRRLPQRGSRS